MHSVPCFIREEVSGKANGIKIILAIKKFKKSAANGQGSLLSESNYQKGLQVKCKRLRDFPTIFTKKTYQEYSSYKRHPPMFNKTTKSKDPTSQAQAILSMKKIDTHPKSIQKLRKRYSLDPPGRRLKTEDGVCIRQAGRGKAEYFNQCVKQIRFEKFKERLQKLKEKGSLSFQSAVKSGREGEAYHPDHKFQKYRAAQIGHNSSVLITAGCDLHQKPNKDEFLSFSTLKRRLQMGRMTKRKGSQAPQAEDQLSGWDNIQWGRQKHSFFDECGQPI